MSSLVIVYSPRKEIIPPLTKDLGLGTVVISLNGIETPHTDAERAELVAKVIALLFPVTDEESAGNGRGMR